MNTLNNLNFDACFTIQFLSFFGTSRCAFIAPSTPGGISTCLHCFSLLLHSMTSSYVFNNKSKWKPRHSSSKLFLLGKITSLSVNQKTRNSGLDLNATGGAGSFHHSCHFYQLKMHKSLQACWRRSVKTPEKACEGEQIWKAQTKCQRKGAGDRKAPNLQNMSQHRIHLLTASPSPPKM